MLSRTPRAGTSAPSAAADSESKAGVKSESSHYVVRLCTYNVFIIMIFMEKNCSGIKSTSYKFKRKMLVLMDELCSTYYLLKRSRKRG